MCTVSPALASQEATDLLTRYIKPLPALCAQLTYAVYVAQSNPWPSDGGDDALPRALRDTYAECLSLYESILRSSQDEENSRPAVHFTQYSSPPAMRTRRADSLSKSIMLTSF